MSVAPRPRDSRQRLISRSAIRAVVISAAVGIVLIRWLGFERLDAGNLPKLHSEPPAIANLWRAWAQFVSNSQHDRLAGFAARQHTRLDIVNHLSLGQRVDLEDSDLDKTRCGQRI